MDEAIEALAEQLRAAGSARKLLRIRAGGSKDFYGNPPSGAVLDPRAVSGVVAYSPPNWRWSRVAARRSPKSKRCSTRMGRCWHSSRRGSVRGHDRRLCRQRHEPPRRAAAGYAYGGVRDFVLGAKLLDGRSQLLAFGGMVMKNVAGYDAARLLVGSLGVLGIIVEVSLKVVPKHGVETTLQFAMRESAALDQLNSWGGQPLPISASAWQDRRPPGTTLRLQRGRNFRSRKNGRRAARSGYRRTLVAKPARADRCFFCRRRCVVAPVAATDRGSAGHGRAAAD